MASESESQSYFFGAFPLPPPDGLPVVLGKFGVGFGLDGFEPLAIMINLK